MAISTDAIIEFFGTQDTVYSTPAAVNDGAFSASPTSWTNDDDAPRASFVLMTNYSVAPTANSNINLYARLMNIDGTADAPVPSSDCRSVYLGSFVVDDVTTAQYHAIDCELPNTATSQVYDFYIENDTGQQIPANWTLKVTPKAYGPHG